MTFNVQLQEMRKTYFKHISFNKKKKKFKCAADTESEPFQTQHLCIIIVCMSNLEKEEKFMIFESGSGNFLIMQTDQNVRNADYKLTYKKLAHT